MGRHLTLLLPALLTLGCPTNNGTDPPNNRLFFPIAAALHRPTASAPPDLLYVVNANFDLQYNGSTVTAVDLGALNMRFDSARAYRVAQLACAARGEQSCALPVLPADCANALRGYDGVVCDDARAGVGTPLLRTAITRKVNPYAVDAAIGMYPPNGASPTQRLYVLVRGGNSLLWLDVRPDGALECGARTPDDQPGSDPNAVHAYCDDSHASGGGSLAIDPSALSVDPQRGWIVVTHQSTDTTSPRATLFYDDIERPLDQNPRPRLLNAVGGLAPGLSSLVFLQGASASRSTWIATSRTAPVFTTLQAYAGTPTLNDNRVFLYRASEAPVTGLLSGTDSRAIVLDPRNGQRAYVTSRRPEALVSVDVSNPATPVVTDAIPLPGGPSRLAAVNDTVNRRTVVYTISYDARWIYAVDPAQRQVIAQIPSGRGPHAVVHDDARGLLYVLDFLDAAVEVIDVNPTRDGAANPTYNRRVLTFGRPGRS